MTHTFKLEGMDGTPARPPSFKTTVLAWNPGDGSTSLPGERSRSSAYAATTPTSSPSWSSRTCPEERLARRARVS
jgi:hypothetical protein